MDVSVLSSCVRNRFGRTKTESSGRPDFPAVQQGYEVVRHGRFFRELRILLISKASFDLSLQKNNGNKIAQNSRILSIIILIMGKTIPALLSRVARLLVGFGENLKLARLRRKFSADSVAQRAGITRRTLYKVEQGDPGVALGVYARVMQVLRLEGDLSHLAVDDVLGRKLQDAGIMSKRRAPKKESMPSADAVPDRNDSREA